MAVSDTVLDMIIPTANVSLLEVFVSALKDAAIGKKTGIKWHRNKAHTHP